MKKLFTVLAFLFVIKSYAQSYYKNLFDSKQYDVVPDNSKSPNQVEFSWIVSAHMEALALMYEKTHDVKYANVLIGTIGNVIDRRDDLRDQLQPPQTGINNISDYRGVSGAAWSTNHYNTTPDVGATYAHMVHSANIIYPMAKFAAIVKNDSTLHNLKYTLEGRYNDMTFKAISDDLKQKVRETLLYHEGQWYTEPNSNNSIGYYKERNDNPPIHNAGVILPFNMQSAMGRVLVQMYMATDNPDYLTQINQITNFLKANTSFNTNLGSNSWTYWKKDTLREDISHGGLTISFPYECRKYNISNGSTPIYTDSDMQAYANTLTKDIYQSPLYINNGVNYPGEYWNLKSGYRMGNADLSTYTCFQWASLSKYDAKIYQLLAEMQTAENYYTPLTPENFPLVVAYLAYYENLIVPVNTEHGWGSSSDWRGVASGNFDGDSAHEFVVIRNYDGMIGTMEPVGKKFHSVTNDKYYSGQYDWRGVAAGDFFGDSKSEIIALSNHSDSSNNGAYILKIENNNIVEQTKSIGWETQSDWVGAAAGNFITGGKDDFIAVRNLNKEVIVFKFNGTTPEQVYINTLNLPADSKIAAVASGNLDSDAKDEIVLLVNSSTAAYNGIHVYDIDDNGIMTKIAEHTLWGIASEWRGLAVGNLDGDGADEIIAHRNFDGDYKLFKLNGNILSGNTSEKFPIQQTNDNIMCFGNFNSSSQNDELVTLRKDGGIVMFSAAKVINSNPNPNKTADPCQNEIPSELFSFMKSPSFNKQDLKEIVSVK
ncbi:VCBS repeat-containing protein [Chryseobacterium sp. JV274]|uniref:VCBS repeat-containing protein n=1 Tax=Chryseobacterium sp. JV274 TaxID=1932669 RepID=UPI0015C1D20B|nr:VCBS repeat-containing protein [Chryseobacterium sp. JV274]CAD0221712.1 conserved protein of unknown function [Chryseobacterium sp. JV274]